MRTVLKSGWLYLFLWLCFLGLILLLPVPSKAELKTFYKYYPRFAIQGDTLLIWQVDTTDVDVSAEIAWERSKFDIVVEGYPVQYPNSRRLFYDPNTTLLPLTDDTTNEFPSGNVTFPINANYIGKYDSLLSFSSRLGIDPESMFLHCDTNDIYDYSTVLTADYFLQGWSDLNDTNSNNIRDYIGTYGKATRYGLNYLIKDNSMTNWTTNYYADSFGVYEIKGNFIDTVEGNSTDSLWWDLGDTTDLVLNSGFETGDLDSIPSNWTQHGSPSFLGKVAIPHTDSYSVKLRGASGYTDIAIKQLSIQTPSHYDYIFRAWYKTDANYTSDDTTRPLVEVVRADNEGLMLSRYWIPNDSADGNWHIYIDTFSSYAYSQWNDSMVVYLGVFQQYGDTSWNEDDSIYFDDINLIPLEGFLVLYEGVRPYIIDRLTAPVHSAIAQTESTARINIDWFFTNWIMYIGNPNYVQFQKEYITNLFSIRPYGDGVMLDQNWAYVPSGASFRCIEYQADEGGGNLSGNNQWATDLRVLLQAINDTLNVSGKLTIANTNNEMDTIYVQYVDGQYEEGGAISYIAPCASSFDSFSLGRAYPYNYHRGFLWMWDTVQVLGKINLVQTDWNVVENYAGKNRAIVSAYANYKIGESDSTYFRYEINSQPLTYQNYWADLFDVDIGTAIEKAFEFVSGIDDSGLYYTIIGRKYYGGETNDTVLVLYKPKSCDRDTLEWWSCYPTGSPYGVNCNVLVYDYNYTDSATWDKFPATTHYLGGTYVPLDWTGRAGTVSDSVSLLYNQGTILIRLSCD